MSMTGPDQTTQTSGQVRGAATDSFPTRRRDWMETKPSFLTTEFWLTLAGVVALIVGYNVVDNADFTLWRALLLSTVLGAAYVVSRGIAKSCTGHRGDY